MSTFIAWVVWRPANVTRGAYSEYFLLILWAQLLHVGSRGPITNFPSHALTLRGCWCHPVTAGTRCPTASNSAASFEVIAQMSTVKPDR